MDFFAHALWMYILFYNKPYLWLAVLFGVLPDLLTFGFNFVEFFITRKYKKIDFKDPEQMLKYVPKYVFKLYEWTHSLVTFFVIYILVFLITGDMPLYMWGWAFHILIDIPTHTKKFFPVRFMYPISNYAIDGIIWRTKRFMITNYVLIIIFLVIRIFRLV